MVSITGDDVTVINRALHTNHDGFLSDGSKPADQAHAVHLPRAFFEPSNKQHIPVIVEKLVRVGAAYCYAARCCLLLPFPVFD